MMNVHNSALRKSGQKMRYRLTTETNLWPASIIVTFCRNLKTVQALLALKSDSPRLQCGALNLPEPRLQ